MRRLELVAALALGTSAALAAFASHRAEAAGSQLNVRMGYVGSRYRLVASGASTDFAVPSSVDADLEFFSRPQWSFFARTTFSYDLSRAVVGYLYVGGGARYWLGGGGMNFAEKGSEFQVAQTRRWRYFVGVDLGISNAVVQSLTEALVSQAGLISTGAQAGVTRQITESWGITLLLGAGVGTSFTNISATSRTIQALVGVSHSL